MAGWKGFEVVNGSRVVVQHGPVPAPLSLLHNSASKDTFSNGPVLTKKAIGGLIGHTPFFQPSPNPSTILPRRRKVRRVERDWPRARKR